jgi:hypothetical protein
MSDRLEDSRIGPMAVYEAPRLTPIGNLRDILAGPGSTPCEGGPIASGGDEQPVMGICPE